MQIGFVKLRLTDEEIGDAIHLDTEYTFPCSDGSSNITFDCRPIADAQLAKAQPVIVRLEAEKKKLEKQVALDKKTYHSIALQLRLTLKDCADLKQQVAGLIEIIRELYSAHIKYQTQLDCDAPREHNKMMGKACEALREFEAMKAREQGKEK